MSKVKIYVETRAYYFVSDGEARFVDVDAMDDRTSDSDASDLTNRRRDFRESVVARDRICVITGDINKNCNACHILPEATGDIYDSADDLNDINDTRNGLVLISLLHRPLRAGQLVFLKTPNFALTVDDIPYHQACEESPASHLTLHYFIDSPRLDVVIPKIAPHNSDARQPQDTGKWPPVLIADLFYATAALSAWSPKSFIKYVRQRSRDAYHDDGRDDGNALDGGGTGHVDTQTGNQATGQSGSGRYPLCSRNKTSNIPTGQLKEERFADLMGGVSALWMQSSGVDKPKPEGVCTSARNDSVKIWLLG